MAFTMATIGFALFETAIGHCGIAWSPQGLTGVQLPERDVAATHARMRVRFSQAAPITPPAAVQQAIDKIVALLAGQQPEPADLSRWVKPWGTTRLRRLCRATASWPPTAGPAASPPMAAHEPNCGCSRSRVRSSEDRGCSARRSAVAVAIAAALPQPPSIG